MDEPATPGSDGAHPPPEHYLAVPELPARGRYGPLSNRLVALDVVSILAGLTVLLFYLLAQRGALPGGTTTTGTVTAVRSQGSCAGRYGCNTSWYWTVDFPVGSGQYSELQVGPVDHSVAVGTTQQISYVPSDPQNARDLSLDQYPLVLGFATGGVLIAFGIGSLAVAWRKGRRARGRPGAIAPTFARHWVFHHPRTLTARWLVAVVSVVALAIFSFGRSARGVPAATSTSALPVVSMPPLPSLTVVPNPTGTLSPTARAAACSAVKDVESWVVASGSAIDAGDAPALYAVPPLTNTDEVGELLTPAAVYAAMSTISTAVFKAANQVGINDPAARSDFAAVSTGANVRKVDSWYARTCRGKLPGSW